MRCMIQTQESEAAMNSRRGRGRSRVAIGEHQLRYLVEQGKGYCQDIWMQYPHN